MKVKFQFDYAEISTIHDSLCKYLDYLKDQCDRANAPEDLWKDSLAYHLYCEFRGWLEEMEGNVKQ